jgi:hypothetical protein
MSPDGREGRNADHGCSPRPRVLGPVRDEALQEVGRVIPEELVREELIADSRNAGRRRCMGSSISAR